MAINNVSFFFWNKEKSQKRILEIGINGTKLVYDKFKEINFESGVVTNISLKNKEDVLVLNKNHNLIVTQFDFSECINCSFLFFENNNWAFSSYAVNSNKTIAPFSIISKASTVIVLPTEKTSSMIFFLKEQKFESMEQIKMRIENKYRNFSNSKIISTFNEFSKGFIMTSSKILDVIVLKKEIQKRNLNINIHGTKDSIRLFNWMY